MLRKAEQRLSGFWQELCGSFGFLVSTADLVKLREAGQRHGFASRIWLLKLYAKTTAVPNVSDFLEWAEGLEAPTEMVCAAYISGIPELLEKADELETLLGAWFPNEAVVLRIRELEEELECLLD